MHFSLKIFLYFFVTIIYINIIVGLLAITPGIAGPLTFVGWGGLFILNSVFVISLIGDISKMEYYEDYEKENEEIITTF